MTASIPLTNAAQALRSAREQRGLTVAQAEQATRIAQPYLEALESDDPIDSFPSPTYARLFLRTYARFLGLDEAAMVALFQARHGGSPAPPSLPLPDAAHVRPSGRHVPDEPVGIHPDIVTSAGRAQPLRGAIRDRARERRRRGGGSISRVPVDIRRDAGSAAIRRRRRRRREAFLAGSVAVAILGVATSFEAHHALTTQDIAAVTAVPTPPPPAPLPRGGTTLFPNYRIVAFYGAARTEALGILGEGPDRAVPTLEAQAEPYGADGKAILPAMELIATIASNHPGPDGKYRNRIDPTVIGGYLAAAREARMLLVLDVQPGRADFMTEVKVLEPWLVQPDVGLAIDPEWHVGPTQVPGQSIGSVDAATVNAVSAWLAGIVRQHRLPQKLFIVHQFTVTMIHDKHAIVSRPELGTVLDVDGYGSQENKISKYVAFGRGYQTRFAHGFKLYYHQDQPLMTPKQVLKLSPSPDYVVYQ